MCGLQHLLRETSHSLPSKCSKSFTAFQFSYYYPIFESFILSKRSTATQSYSNVEIDNSSVLVVGDVGGLHPYVGDVNGAGEQEEDSQARQQQAECHRYGDIEFSAGDRKREVRP